MARRLAEHQLAVVIDGLITDLQVCKVAGPIIDDQSRHEHNELAGGLPAAGVQCRLVECDGTDHDGLGPHARRDMLPTSTNLSHSDPTGDTVVRGPAWSDREVSPARDRERLEAFTSDLVRLVGSSRALLAQAPAVTTAVRKGRTPTDGRSEQERILARTGAVEGESACQACDLGVSEVGRLKAGLCPTDYSAWWRARGADPDLDRQLWLIDRRARLAEQLEQPAGVLVDGPWGPGWEQAA